MPGRPPLLVLADGGKPRLRRAPRYPVPKESRLHVDTVDLLRAHCLPDWRWRHLNAKAKDAREGRIMKALGVQRGWPDLLLISPQRRPHFLELKRLGEGLRDEQREFQAWCVRCGIPHAVAWTMDQVLAAFDEWGCLRIRVAGHARGASETAE